MDMAPVRSARRNSESICICNCYYALILALYFVSGFEISGGTHLPPVDFSYTEFEPGKEIQTFGDARFDGKTLQLTTGGLQHSVGRALRSNAVKIWDRSTGLTLSFSTSFTFSIKIRDTDNYGDGLAFGLFPTKEIPANSSGEFLGLFDPNSTEGNHVVAVEFDLFKNSFDPDSNHVGLDFNSVKSTCSALLKNFGVSLKAGNNISAQIDYDGLTERWNMYAINETLGNPLNNPVLSCELNVSRANLSEEVFVGFSAATGNNGELHTIHAWSFRAWDARSSKSKRNTILGVTLGVFLFGVGVILGVLYYRRRRRLKKESLLAFLQTSHDHRSNPTSDLSKEIIRACDWDVFPRKFTYEELSHATNDFDSKGLLGEGGFGDVFKGTVLKSKNSCY